MSYKKLIEYMHLYRCDLISRETLLGHIKVWQGALR